MKRKTILITMLFYALLLQISCSKEESVINDNNVSPEVLPADTGGTHTAYLLGTTDASFGYYLYEPSGYEEVSYDYPLLVFLHGKSERGDGSSDPEVLAKVLKNGPPKLIEKGEWSPIYPMLVVSPQYHGEGGDVNNWGAGDPENLRGFIQYMIEHYRVNTHRIYLTGLSHGGNGVYDYLTRLHDSVNYIAAAAPIAAYGKKSGFYNSANTPIWVFVGDKDATNFKTSTNFVNSYNSQDPAPKYKAKMTVYNGAGHNVWTRTYNGEGMGTEDPEYDSFDQSLYEWMFQYERE